MMKRKLLKFLIYFVILWFIGHITYISIDGLTDYNYSADLAVILGNKVNVDGTPSERLEKRLECGLTLFKTGRVKNILVSGGLGEEGHHEGSKMKDFLVKNGVPDTSIIVDNHGNNTEATVVNTLKLKDSLNFKSLIVVSQYFHVTRTKMLFRKKQFYKISSVSPKYFEIRDIYSLTREFFAYYSQ